MSRFAMFVLGAFIGALGMLAIHTWGGDHGLDDLSKWVRKTTGTERSFAEKVKNKVDEFGDALKGDSAVSTKVRKTGKEIKEKAGEALNEARESLGDAAETVKEKAEDLKHGAD